MNDSHACISYMGATVVWYPGALRIYPELGDGATITKKRLGDQPYRSRQQPFVRCDLFAIPGHDGPAGFQHASIVVSQFAISIATFVSVFSELHLYETSVHSLT